MLGFAIRFALSQRLLVLLAVGALIGGGWLALVHTPIDAYPDVSTTQVKVVVKAPGMTPEEVEQRITARIEVELLGIPHQTTLRSISKYGLADVTVDFEDGSDIYWARQQVAERLAGIWEDLPDGVRGGLAPMTTPLGEMFMFTIEGGDLSLEERRTLLDWTIRPALRTVPGVADVNALGGFVRTFEVVPDGARMNARGITVEQLRAALGANNRNEGAGRLGYGEEVLLVRAEGGVRVPADISAIVVAADSAEPVRVGDVAAVRVGALTRYGAVSADGRGEAVEGLVLGLRGANAQQVVQGVRRKLEELSRTLPAGARFRVFYDRGELVAHAVAGVRRALFEAIVLVLLLLIVFLGNARAALTVALILPLAALATFVAMYAVGLSANLMSLGGLAIAIGMLVDAAVVVVENVVTRLGEQSERGRVPQLHVIYRAAKEVARPTAAGMGIIVVVFLPLLTLQGLEGKLFGPVALTIVFALSAALVLSLTVIPVLASFLLGAGHAGEPALVRWLHRAYAPVLAWCLRRSGAVVAGAVLLLALAGLLYLRVGKTFLPTMDEGSVIVQLEKSPAIGLEAAVALDNRLQRALLEAVPEITGIVARTGADEIGLDPMGLNETDAFLQLRPRDAWRMASREALVEELRRVLDGFPGLGHTFTQPIEMRVAEMLTGVRGDVAVKIFGPDLDDLNRTADELVRLLRAIPGAEDVYTPRNTGALYQNLRIDRLEAGRRGLSVDAVGSFLRAQLEGVPVGTVYEGGRRTPLVLRGDETMRTSPAELSALQLTLPGGGRASLSGLVTMERVEGPVSLRRESASRMAVVIANVAGRDLVGFVDEARRRVGESLPLPAGFLLEWGGQFENQQRAARRLGLVVPVALTLIFLLLFSTFGSVRQAGLVLSNVPFAMIGGVVALWATGEYLSVPASVGFIALLGIAVLNGVVMVTHFNELRALGVPIERVVVEGAQRRLRPVLMTATIAAFGLVPLLFARGPGSEIQRPLAIVVIGGLVSATALTLVLLPILYRRFGAVS